MPDLRRHQAVLLLFRGIYQEDISFSVSYTLIYSKSAKQFFNGQFVAKSVLNAECQLTYGSVKRCGI